LRLRALLAVLGGLGILVAAALPFLAWVPDEEMAPSLLPGDLVLLWPGDIVTGDVVAVVDPLDPSRWTLRRVLATSGAVRFDNGFFHTDAEEPPVLEMGHLGDQNVLKEGAHLTQRLTRPVRWELGDVVLPEGRVWLAADNRDVAMDSRWWGPVPGEALQGVVLLRVGRPGHVWRGWVSTSP
jgi:signal peptidase I